MSQRTQNLKDALTTSHQRVNYVLDRVGDRWQTPVYSEGAAWNVQQLALHLSISNRGQLNQVVGIAEGREVVPADFDLERFNRRSVEKGADKSIEEVRGALETIYQETLAWLDNASDEALDRKGRHASMHILSVEEILRHIAEHETIHANDIAQILGIE